jgi:hypothetical protein
MNYMIISVALPESGKILLKVGQHVSMGDPFYSINPHTDVRLSLAAQLAFDPKHIFKHLKKNIGDKIYKDDVLAEKKTLFSSKQYRSEYEGFIKEVNHIEGIVVLEVAMDDKEEKRAYFAGEVVELNKKELKIKINRGKAFDLKDATSDFGGSVLIKTGNPNNLTEEEIKGSVYCCRRLMGYEQIKIEALGATGIVSLHSLTEITGIPFAQLREIKQWEEIETSSYLCCTVNKKNSTIYFYH